MSIDRKIMFIYRKLLPARCHYLIGFVGGREGWSEQEPGQDDKWKGRETEEQTEA